MSFRHYEYLVIKHGIYFLTVRPILGSPITRSLELSMETIFAAIALCFATNEPNSAQIGVALESSQWRVVLDGVMGGLSSGKLTETPSGLQFTGELSLKNNGGFAWARTRRIDLDTNFQGFEIEVLGDGRTWDFMIDSSRRRMMAGGYRTRFETQKGVRTTHRFPLSGFEAVSFGQVLARGDLRAADCAGLGVLIGDKKEAPFDLTLVKISTYSTPRPSPTEAQTRNRSPEQSILLQAIEMGVPRYNDGDHAGCADLYELAISSVLMMGNVPDALRANTRKDFRAAMTMTSDEDRAWAHRRNMDRMLEQMLQGP